MNAVCIAFKLLDEGHPVPPGYKEIDCHLIFTVKLEDFRRKARFVAGGHLTEAPPPAAAYASVVSRESVRIALTLAALNDLEVKSSDVMNAFLSSPTDEKYYYVCGPEFGKDAGKKALVAVSYTHLTLPTTSRV